MKLSTRKTLVALGTAATMALTGVVAPVNAASSTTTTTTSTSTGNAAYARLYKNVEGSKNILAADVAALDKAIDDRKGELDNDEDALNALDDAKSYLRKAKTILESAQQEFGDLPPADKGDRNKSEYGILQSLETRLSTAKGYVEDANKALKKAKPFTCDAEIAQKNDEENSDGSSFLDFGSLVSSMGSSGEMVVTKNGKKTCVGRVDYFAERLKSVVSILTVLFTVITTVTKISDTLQKQAMPKR